MTPEENKKRPKPALWWVDTYHNRGKVKPMSPEENKKRWDRLKSVRFTDTYSIQKKLGGSGGGPAMQGTQMAEQYLTHHVIFLRRDLPHGGDLNLMVDTIADFFIETNRSAKMWSGWLIGGEIKFVFEDAEDAVIARLLFNH